jgi:hypothetical protein
VAVGVAVGVAVVTVVVIVCGDSGDSRCGDCVATVCGESAKIGRFYASTCTTATHTHFLTTSLQNLMCAAATSMHCYYPLSGHQTLSPHTFSTARYHSKSGDSGNHETVMWRFLVCVCVCVCVCAHTPSSWML